MPMTHLVYVTTSFKPGAIPNIFAAILPFVTKQFRVTVVVFEEEPPPYHQYHYLKDLGVTFHFLNKRKIDVYGTFKALRRCLLSIHPDILHSHLARADIITALVNRGHIPHIATFHSVPANFSWVTRLFLYFTDRWISHRTGVSNTVIAEFYRKPWLKSSHSVVYNPLNGEASLHRGCSPLELRNRFGIPPAAPLLACVGRLVPAKGHETLLRAFALLLKEVPSVYLIIAGSGPLEKSLKKRATQLGIQQHIVWTGFYTPVRDIFTAADVVVFPSRWEGMGLVPLEALLEGRPLVVSDLPVLRECIPPGPGVRFVPPDRPGELAAAMRSMLDVAPHLPREYFEKAWITLQEQYSPYRIAESYLLLYHKITQGRNGSP
ncbi:MAG: glycosyltransferase family 4 protein [Treponemataceae bacterium]|nr:glycosyltransferase family 4 protein [Treponemataceae bacterium]